jgi:D-alanine-D-alanine ligase
MHEDLVPPENLTGQDLESVQWKTEYDVVSTLRKLGHDVKPLGVKSDLGVLRAAVEDWRPHIAFNLLEEFDGVAVYDQNVVSYLERGTKSCRRNSSRSIVFPFPILPWCRWGGP